MTGLETLARRMMDAGYTDERIGGALDISAGLARNWRKAWGLPVASKTGKRRACVSDLADEVNDMRYDGHRPEVIARRVGISRRKVYRLLRPELKTGGKTYSAATRQRLVAHMRRIQPLGTAASRQMIWRGQGEHHGGENPT